LTITKEPFDELLGWLDPDRDTAGQKYVVIRKGLIRIFISHGISDAEYYADETIDRVTKRLPEIRATYVGDATRYFHGVARNITLEARRKREVATEVVPERTTEEISKDDMSECLSECLKDLPSDKRELILDYHLYQGRAKVEHHREMAAELSISEGALRTRAHHLRVSLANCVMECVKSLGGNKTPVPRHKE
jgi:DNA-directed RNA polymerase specialized sigma24 family protein